MRLADWREGWRTDAIPHRFHGEIVERDDCLVVRTPANPTFYWGNCLVVQQPPADGDLAHWLARFEEEIGRRQPGSGHVATGIHRALGMRDLGTATGLQRRPPQDRR